MKKTIFVIILSIFLINLVNASITCSSNSYSNKYDSAPTSQITVTTNCHNSDLNNSVSFYGLGDFFTISGDTIIGAGSTKGQINILLNSGISGENVGYITFTSGENIKINITIGSNPISTTGCRLIELPHTTTFRLKTGETSSSGEIKIKASSECPSLDFNVIETTQMSKPMYLQSKGESIPGKEYSFIIGLDATNVQTGTYNQQYIISGSSGDQVYQKTIPITTVVSLGTTPAVNGTFQLPECTLNSDMVLNSSYKLVCSQPDKNIEISVPYSEFYSGKSVTETEGGIEYIIQPKKVGITTFIAEFKYKGLSIGDAFLKDLKILPSVGASSGINLDILFYQFSERKDIGTLSTGETTILVKDATSGNLVPSFTAYLNGKNINNTFNLESDKNYELIVDSPNYMSKTINFTVKQGSLSIEIYPNQSSYETNDLINITSNVNNTKFLLNDVLITSPYTLISPGFFKLQAVKEGYTTYERNLTVTSSIRYLTITPTISEWKKGNDVEMLLNENASWGVYLDDVLKYSGTGNMVKFKLEESGTYQVKADDTIILPGVTLEKKSWTGYLKFWNWRYYSGWIVLVVIIGGLYLGYRYLFGEEEDIYSDKMPERRE